VLKQQEPRVREQKQQDLLLVAPVAAEPEQWAEGLMPRRRCRFEVAVHQVR
jgi:hypothetical protein